MVTGRPLEDCGSDFACPGATRKGMTSCHREYRLPARSKRLDAMVIGPSADH